MSDWQEQILTLDQQRLLNVLGPVAEEFGFYLAGGTAVALRLGHRRSEDFDWFAPDPKVVPELLLPELADRGLAATPVQTSTGTLHCLINDIRVTFLRYRYSMLEDPEQWPAYGCRIASLADLMCMKLSAVSQRGSRKDFVDIFTVLQRGASLTEAIQDYRRKFGVQDATPVIYGLAYFDDAEKQPMPKMLIATTWAQMKAAIQRWTREAAR